MSDRKGVTKNRDHSDVSNLIGITVVNGLNHLVSFLQ